jgi:hypothetical protein
LNSCKAFIPLQIAAITVTTRFYRLCPASGLAPCWK